MIYKLKRHVTKEMLKECGFADELDDVMFQENSLALDEVRKQITELESELK